jgi:hypothetical protein
MEAYPMRRLSRALLFIVLMSAACSRQEPTPAPADVRVGARPIPAPLGGPLMANPTSAGQSIDPLMVGMPLVSNQERYDAALIDALNLLAERKLAQALAAVRTAQGIQDNEQIRQLAGRIERVMAEQAAAEKITQDLRSAMGSGKADEVARLATGALQQYGGGEAAADLVRIQQEAQALATAGAQDKADQCRRLQNDSQAALRDNNLRASAICLEQALLLRDDPALRQQLSDIHGRLTRYDECRQRAQVLRRDPARLEDALAALRDAAAAWDTLEIRQEIDDYNLALQNRRNRLSVAAFEGDRDVGVPGLGQALADALLPVFKTRFDLAEREQLNRVLEELKLPSALPLEGVARLARVRYVVVGNLSPLDGITASARLVDVDTGLIVQTARVSAATPDALRQRLPALGQMLLMNDDQKMAFELAQAQRAPEVRPIEPVVVVPPPPPLDQPLPPPVITFTARPPVFGGLTVVDFNLLPPVAVVAPPPPPQLVIVREEPRRRLLSLSLELGDNLFRRGRHEEARRHFELALSLTTDRAAIEMRIGRCPPKPPPIVVSQPAVVVAALQPRPRLAVFNFVVNCQPGLVPPACGDWAADQCAARFGGRYEIVDRGEVCWYMGRLGLTMRDVVTDASARLALAQAMNVRFFAFGTIEQTASLNVTTHLIDAQTGARTGTGMIHVQDHNEMKLRMGELAQQVAAPPAEQARLAQQGKDNERALNEARKLMKAGDYARAAAVAQQALQKTPNDVALRTIQHEAEDKARQVALADTRRREAEAGRVAAAAAAQRQRELARQAEAARVKAETEARARGEAAKQEQARQRLVASEQLRAQARAAEKQGHYGQAVQTLQSALALHASDDLKRELEQARDAQAKATRMQAEQKALVDQAAHKAAQDAAQARVAAQQREREAADAEKRRQQQAREQAAAAAKQQQMQVQAARDAQRKQEEAKRQETFANRLAGGQSALAGKRYSEAVQQYTEALKLRPGDATATRGLRDAQHALEISRAPSPPAPPARPAPGQPQNHAPATNSPAPNAQAKYREAMQTAAALEKQGKYSEAVGAYRSALQFMPNDAGATAALRNADFHSHLAEGQKLLAARKFPEATRELEAAVNLDPHSNEAKTLLQKARTGKQ